MSIARIVEVLSEADYGLLPRPLEVSGIRFDFAAAMTGPVGTLSLVIVANGADTRGLAQDVDALAQALDLSEARYSLTVVLEEPFNDDVAMAELLRVSRVLSVPNTLDEALPEPGLRDALSVLLPLRISISARAQDREPLRRVTQQLSPELLQSFFDSSLAQATALGSRDVEMTYADWVLSALEPESDDQ